MNRKGAALIMVIIFILVTAITSVALYNSVYFTGKMQGIDEVRRIRGYYAVSAGLSYAANVILKTSGAGTYDININSTDTEYKTLAQNLGLGPTEHVVIVITDHVGGTYDVSSNFTF